MYDLVAVGELLIDFTPDGENSQGNSLFARNPGGAPANVLVMNAKLGGKTAFIGKVGRDAFGLFLKETLEKNGVDTRGLRIDPAVNTTLAIVQLNSQGDRSFSFYRKPGADIMLRADEIDTKLVEQCRIFHFGSVSLTDEPSRGATLEGARLARKLQKIVSFDPNYRPLLWKDVSEAKSEIRGCLPLADIVKVSEEELELLTDCSSLEEGAEKLKEQGPALILVSLGPKGAFYLAGCGCGILPTYDVKTIDTTGAGDAFFGAALYRLREKNREGLRAIGREELEDIVDFANAAGSLATAAIGAIPAMPAFEQIEHCRRTVPRLG